MLYSSIETMAWLETPWARVGQRLDESRLPHALLVTGEQGVGKRFFADQLAGLLACDRPDQVSKNRCGTCKQCELFAAESHPDIRHYQPEKSRMIKIDQIRALGVFAVASPQVAGRKIAVIDRADQLNINSANALLKTLEEPAENMVLILLQESGRPVLPTIRSRCQALSIPTPPESQAMAWLKSALAEEPSDKQPSAEQCKRALSLAANAPGLALQYAKGDFLTLRADAFDQFRRFMKGQVSLGEASKPFKTLGLEPSLWLFEGWAGDLARISAGGKAHDEDAADMLGFLAKTNPAWRAHELLELIHEARSALVYNVSPELEAGRILIAWQKLMPLKRRAAT